MHRSLSALSLAVGVLCGALVAPSLAQAQALDAAGLQRIAQAVDAAAERIVGWRRDIHQHPELSGQEERTARLVATELRRLGLEVQTGVGGHGVVGTLKGGKPGKVVALRADMDALPVAEATGLPFASQVKATYLGKEVTVMHACGHDAHTAMLLGAAEALAARAISCRARSNSSSSPPRKARRWCPTPTARCPVSAPRP